MFRFLTPLTGRLLVPFLVSATAAPLSPGAASPVAGLQAGLGAAASLSHTHTAAWPCSVSGRLPLSLWLPVNVAAAAALSAPACFHNTAAVIIKSCLFLVWHPHSDKPPLCVCGWGGQSSLRCVDLTPLTAGSMTVGPSVSQSVTSQPRTTGSLPSCLRPPTSDIRTISRPEA